MKPVRIHHPGTPALPEPPLRLLELADNLRDSLVIRSGVTTTEDGRWALYVTVPPETEVPIPSVEQQAEGFPVVYEAEPKEPPVARPATPRKRR
jgi:hypothetical protein